MNFISCIAEGITDVRVTAKEKIICKFFFDRDKHYGHTRDDTRKIVIEVFRRGDSMTVTIDGEEKYNKLILDRVH